MDVGSSRAIGLLLGPSCGVVVESLPGHGRSAPSFDIAVEPHMEDVRMSFEDKHCSASENDCSSVLRQTPQNGLGLGNVGHDAKGFGALCNSDEQAACLQDAVEHSANHGAVLGVVGQGRLERFVNPLRDRHRYRALDQGQSQPLRHRGCDHAASRTIGGRDRHGAHQLATSSGSSRTASAWDRR